MCCPSPIPSDTIGYRGIIHQREQPDTLAAEFAEANIAFHKELKNTDDGLRGFEVRDNYGYALFFGRPAPSDPLG